MHHDNREKEERKDRSIGPEQMKGRAVACRKKSRFKGTNEALRGQRRSRNMKILKRRKSQKNKIRISGQARSK